MKTLKYWLGALSIDSLTVVLLVLWKGHGIEGYGNVLMAYLWLSIVFGFVIGLGADKTQFKVPRPPGFTQYHTITELLLFGARSFFGHYVVAALRLVAVACIELARNREPKTKGGAA